MAARPYTQRGEGGAAPSEKYLILGPPAHSDRVVGAALQHLVSTLRAAQLRKIQGEAYRGREWADRLVLDFSPGC